MLLTTLLFLTLITDLEAVKAEPNPDRRAELALDYANETFDQAKAQYKDAAYDKSRTSVLEVQSAVEVCYDALKSTGKDPRKNARQFKKIESRIQILIRRLKGFGQEVSIEDRPVIKKVEDRLSDINDEIVSGIFKRSK